MTTAPEVILSSWALMSDCCMKFNGVLWTVNIIFTINHNTKKRYKSCHWVGTFSKGTPLYLIYPKRVILLPKWYILVAFNHPSDSFCTFISESDTVQKFGSVRFLEWVWNNVFEVSSAHQSCHLWSKKVKILKYYYNFK